MMSELTSVDSVSDDLRRTVEAAAARLRTLDTGSVGSRPAPGKWSKIEILGHLIDSAANNHQRFVRAQEPDGHMYPPYAQDHWVRVQGYQECPWDEIVELWRLYNLHLSRVIRRIPPERLSAFVRLGGKKLTLGYLVEDYLVHLRHHLRQIEGDAAAE
jgi:hypothetical protein